MAEYDDINIDDIRLNNPRKPAAPQAAVSHTANPMPAAVDSAAGGEDISPAEKNIPGNAPTMEISEEMILRKVVAPPKTSFRTPAPSTAAVPAEKKPPVIPKIKGTAIPDSGLFPLPKIGKRADKDAPATAAEPVKAVPELKRPAAVAEPVRAVPELKRPSAPSVPAAEEKKLEEKGKRKAAPPAPAAPPAMAAPGLNRPPAGIPVNKAPEMQSRNYFKGCLLFLLASIVFIGGGGYLCVRFKEPIREYLGRFEQWMIDHKLAFDGGDAPWKHQSENEAAKQKEAEKKPENAASGQSGAGSVPEKSTAAPKKKKSSKKQAASTVYGKSLQHASNSADKFSKSRENIPEE